MACCIQKTVVITFPNGVLHHVDRDSDGLFHCPHCEHMTPNARELVVRFRRV